MDFWVIGINLLGVASLSGAINFIVTILRMRAPGLTINRMPLFSWMRWSRRSCWSSRCRA